MKKTVPFHPLVFALFPVLSLYSANVSVVSFSELGRPLLLVFLAAGACWIVLAGITRSWERGAAATTVLVISFFGYSNMAQWFGLGSVLWGLLTVCAATLAAVKWRWPVVLNIFGSFLLLSSSGQIALGLLHVRNLPTAKADGITATRLPPSPPDIVYIILDGYGRSDTLKRVLGFDNSAFINELKRRGFYVADQGVANYCQTEISLSSSLNMQFIQTLEPGMSRYEMSRSPFDQLIEKNAVAAFLRSCGYVWVGVTTGFPPVQLANADIRLRDTGKLTLFESALILMTPLKDDDRTVESMFRQRREALNEAFDELSNLGPAGSKPRFIFAHILAPHPPFVFGPNGESRREGIFGFWDGSDYLTYVGNREAYRKGYSGQAAHISQLTLHMLDHLLEGTGPKPIVIIQGDHGSKMHLDQNNLKNTDVTECFPNLNAYYVPPEIRARLYPTITPVNSFRIILSSLFGAKLPLLPDRSWYSPFAFPFEFTEVTDRVRSGHAALDRAEAPNMAVKASTTAGSKSEPERSHM